MNPFIKQIEENNCFIEWQENEIEKNEKENEITNNITHPNETLKKVHFDVSLFS